jgi:YD repeat-containing protein
MTLVQEDPSGLNYKTVYSYDALNNLLSVTQNGSNSGSARIRTFTYDSLSRLLCAANPEVELVTCPAAPALVGAVISRTPVLFARDTVQVFFDYLLAAAACNDRT